MPGPPPSLDDPMERPAAPGVVPERMAVAPLRPMERAWLLAWRTQLDPRLHAPLPAVAVVSHLVREQPDPSGVRLPGSRYLPGIGETRAGGVTDDAPDHPAPRSMGIAPAHPHGVARRTAEVLAVLSACLDPAERRPAGHAVRAAYLASRLAAELELGDEARSDLLYAGLLRDAGSTGLEPADVEPPVETRRRGHHRAGGMAPTGTAHSAGRAAPHLSRPDRAAALVRVLGLPAGVMEAVASAEERWDGKGPRHERRTAVPMGARVLRLAVTAALAAAAPRATPETIARALRRERGSILDPALVDAALDLARGGLWAELGSPALTKRMLELEPLHRERQSDEAGLDAIAGAFADLVDTRTPAMGRHGRRVAEFAARTSAALGLEPRVATDVRRAALLHDLGKLLVPIAYLEKSERLLPHEKQVIDEHARHGAAVLERSRVLGGLAPLVAGHHERLDGTGRLPTLVDDDRELGARIIAIADRFEAMTADRAYRPALSPGQAWQELHAEITEPLASVALRVMERTIGSGRAAG